MGHGPWQTLNLDINKPAVSRRLESRNPPCYEGKTLLLLLCPILSDLIPLNISALRISLRENVTLSFAFDHGHFS